MRPLLLGSAVFALALGAQAIAADWPQRLGPGRVAPDGKMMAVAVKTAPATMAWQQP